MKEELKMLKDTKEKPKKRTHTISFREGVHENSYSKSKTTENKNNNSKKNSE